MVKKKEGKGDKTRLRSANEVRKGRWNKEYKLVSFDYIITIGCVWDDELEDER